MTTDAYSRNWMDLKWINYRPIWTWDEVNKSGKFQLMSHETNRWIREYDMFGKSSEFLLDLLVPQNSQICSSYPGRVEINFQYGGGGVHVTISLLDPKY